MTTIICKTFDDESNEVDTLLEVESTDYDEVDVVLGPRTEEALTFTLSTEEAWRLARELVRAAAGVEINREARTLAPDA